MYLGEGTLDLPEIKEEPSLIPVSHSSKVLTHSHILFAVLIDVFDVLL